MYAPLPPRPRKTNISRSRKGCVPCRRKKRKCDEARPQCVRCVRTRTSCWFQELPLRFRPVGMHTRMELNDLESDQQEYSMIAMQVPSKFKRYRGCSSDTRVDDCLISSNLPQPLSLPDEKKQLSFQKSAVCVTTEQLYLSYFSQELVTTLPESVRAVASKMTELSGLREAAIAVSAARLASIKSEPRLSPHIIPLFQRPRLQHFSEALSRFISAVQQIQSHPADVENVLAAVIHFILFELVVGTLWGVYCHVAGLDNLLMLHQDVLMESQYGRTLVRAGVFLRTRTLFLLSPLSLFRTGPIAGRHLQSLVDEMAQPREIIYINMTKAVSMTTRLVLMDCMQHGHRTWHSVAGKVYSRPQDISMRLGDISVLHDATKGGNIYVYLKELKEQNKAAIFDTGYGLLGTMLSELKESSPNELHSFLNIPEIHPIRFDHCEDAIFYAVYALTQIYCDGELLQSLLHGQEIESSPHVTGYARMILGIAKGYDPASCLCDSVYNMNISWVLFLLALRWPTQEMVIYLKDDFLPRLQRTDSPREDIVGSLPSFAQVVNVLDTESKRGRRIYTMQPVYANSAEREHFFLMNQVEGYALHGRDSAGHFFNDYISLLDPSFTHIQGRQ
ncbi:hypothetical protein BDV26DRAFT_263745 [Aspergillus bertholletiae]|uniref:Zn(2)-C6 fungal-type domain-containing protein n=1 Tax=Aspergillus bertholletiae TaxID=1226010 RepID=A0A5N7B5N4_9EURO|nr:hypothetical protein BDV26DRAFT_263745 [Aspergillus bertholletiae]